MLGCNDEVQPLSLNGQMLLRPRTGIKAKPLWLKPSEPRQYRMLLNRLSDRTVDGNPYKCKHDYASVQVRRRLGEGKAPVVVSSNVLRYGGSSQRGHMNTFFTDALPPQVVNIPPASDSHLVIDMDGITSVEWVIGVALII
jgi:hypothetical protein